ncbi:MAG: alpha/beta fold hydrolase [Silicimonas sp.]|nr:alpha/beta fold hydrolase [Silicimonas sp.]
MADFVLVHGASHGAWCWNHILPRLDALGHTARAVDLPGDEGVTLEAYRDTVLDTLNPGSILVGHSLAGLTITLAGAARASEIAALVYVAAFVPEPGSRFLDIRKTAVNPDLDQVAHRVGGLSRVDGTAGADLFYGQCSAEDRAFACKNLRPQPVSVMAQPLEFEGPLPPSHYVLCSRDRVVLPAYQRAICADWPAARRHELATDHSPFFSDPEGLTKALDRIASP